MMLAPLSPIRDDQPSVTLTCIGCGVHMTYRTATKEHWTADLDGRAFVDYRCESCSEAILFGKLQLEATDAR